MDPAFLDPLLSCAGDWSYQQKCASIAAFGVGDDDFNTQVLTPEQTALPDVERKRTGILFGGLNKLSCPQIVQLEIQLQPKLDYPRVSGRKDSPKCGSLATDVRRTEVGVVECIEQFGSKLEEPILVEMNILRDRKIEICQAWAAHDSHARISEGLRNGTRNRKRPGIEPPFHGLL